MQKVDRERLLEIERRILEADEKLLAAQKGLAVAGCGDGTNCGMRRHVSLMATALQDLRTYRDLLITALHSAREAGGD